MKQTPDIIDLVLVPMGVTREAFYRFVVQFALIVMGIGFGKTFDYPQAIVVGALWLSMLKIVIPYIVSFLARFGGGE